MRFTTAESTVEYTPEYGGNRDEPCPATFRLEPLNAGELRAHRLRLTRAVDRKRSSDAQDEVNSVLSNGVLSLSGVTLRTIGTDGTVVDTDLTSVAEFLEQAPEKLKLELYEALTNPTKLDGGVEGIRGN